MVCPALLLIFRVACCGNGFDSWSVFLSSGIISILCPDSANEALLPEKGKTDLKRSVSLLAPHHPSDQVQVVAQRLPESPVFTLSVWFFLLCSVSRRGFPESLAPLSGTVAGGAVCCVSAWHEDVESGYCSRDAVEVVEELAAEPGFEPGLRDPNSPVLPLHHSATLCAQRLLEL